MLTTQSSKMAPTTRANDRNKKPLFVHLDTEVIFSDLQCQIYFTNISTALNKFTIKEVISTVRTQFLLLTIPNNPFIVKTDHNIRSFFGTELRFFYNSEWIDLIHKIIKPVDETSHKCFYITETMRKSADISCYPLIRKIICIGATPVSVNPPLMEFMREFTHFETPLFSVTDIKAALQQYIQQNRNVLIYEHNQDLLLLEGTPLKNLYGCEVIHINQADNIFFNSSFMTANQTLQILNP